MFIHCQWFFWRAILQHQTVRYWILNRNEHRGAGNIQTWSLNRRFCSAIVVKKKKKIKKHYLATQHSFSWEHLEIPTFSSSVSTYVNEINHTHFEVLFISLIHCSQLLKLPAELCFSLLIRQQLISSQAACALKQEHRGMRTGTHVCVRHVQHTSIITKWQRFKTMAPWLTETSYQTCKHAWKQWRIAFAARVTARAHRAWADKDISNAHLQPAKQTKLTYSLIAFNKDNVSPECRWDLERWRCLCALPQTGCHAKQSRRADF